MTRRVGIFAIVCCVVFPAAAHAQYRVLNEPAPESGSGKRGLYLKVGLAYWQGDVFSESSLTQWDVDLFGAEYDLTSAAVEIEGYLGKGLIVPGFTLGYRKDDTRTVESGHMVSGALFAGVDLRVLMIKAGGGIEWGVPSMSFDQTRFEYAADGTVRYRHTYPNRNAEVPVGTRSNGARYPFAVVSAVTRPGPFLFEVGMRVNMVNFRFDDYEIRPGDQVTRVFAERRVKMPVLFANVGIKWF